MSAAGPIFPEIGSCLGQNLIPFSNPAVLQKGASIAVKSVRHGLRVDTPGGDYFLFCIGHDRKALSRAAGVKEKPAKVHLGDQGQLMIRSPYHLCHLERKALAPFGGIKLLERPLSLAQVGVDL